VRGPSDASDVPTLLQPVGSLPQGWVSILSGLAQARGSYGEAGGLLAFVGGVMLTRMPVEHQPAGSWVVPFDSGNSSSGGSACTLTLDDVLHPARSQPKWGRSFGVGRILRGSQLGSQAEPSGSSLPGHRDDQSGIVARWYRRTVGCRPDSSGRQGRRSNRSQSSRVDPSGPTGSFGVLSWAPGGVFRWFATAAL